MLSCPDCGSTELKLREAESTDFVRWYNCENGHRFPSKTGLGRAGEYTGIVIAATVVARLLLDHHGIFDVFDDMSGY